MLYLKQQPPGCHPEGEAMSRIPSAGSLSLNRRISLFRLITQRLSWQPACLAALVLGSVTLLGGAPAARDADLSFEQRVSAQEAIQRVYYAHQLSTTLPFDKALPREVLEKQVRDYLQKSAALEIFWKSPVTHDALRAELERIARDSRFPDRLREITTALDDNPLLIEECFARPALVDRLVNNFFATDQRVHATERSQAEELRHHLVSGDLSVDAPESHRSVREVAEAPPVDGEA